MSKVYFICPKPETPSGGVWLIHRIVGLLNQMGIESYVWTPKPFEVTWDAHPIDPAFVKNSIQPGRDDIVVVPEVNWPSTDMNGARLIIFVQNYIWINQEAFRNNPADVLVCSRFLANRMQRLFDAKIIGKITPFLDDDVWFPSPKQTNRTLIFARRNNYHAKMRDLLESDGFPVEYITESLTQRQIAEKLSQCEFYIHLTHPEGFPMACLEAMRSGTIVVGTTGGGGNEFMQNGETAVCVQDPDNGGYGNPDEFLRRIMEQMVALRNNPGDRSRIWTQAHAWSMRYNAEATKADLKQIFVR